LSTAFRHLEEATRTKQAVRGRVWTLLEAMAPIGRCWGRLVGAGASASHDARPASFGLGLDRRQRGRHRLLPAARDQRTPALSRPPQVGPDLPVVGQPRAGPAGLLAEHERLHDVGNRPADQPEVDPLGSGEPHRLHRLGDQAQPPTQRGQVGGQHHVAAAFQHPELVGQRPWCPTQIRLGDDVEDHLTGGGHVDQLWAERPDPPADAKVQRAGAGHQPDIAGRGHPGAHRHIAEQSRDRTGHEQAPRSGRGPAGATRTLWPAAVRSSDRFQHPSLDRARLRGNRGCGARAGLGGRAPVPCVVPSPHKQLGQTPQFIVAQ
jgi:hypothetical protein